jgi:hypothetical protein
MTSTSRFRLVDQPVHRPWMSAHGTWPHQSVQAGCDCGWNGPSRPLSASSHTQVHDDLELHLAESPSAADLSDEETHRRCGYRHHPQDDCPAPPTSPAGMLRRALTSGLGQPERALDRIRAITALQAWLEQTEAEAVIAVALNQMSWHELADAAGIGIDEAKARWASQLDRYATAGILPAMTDKPTAHWIPPAS